MSGGRYEIRLAGVGVISLAKLLGVLGILLGLITGALYGTFFSGLIGLLGGGNTESWLLGALGGGLTLVLVTLVSGLTWFCSGLVYGLLLNLVLYLSGGVRLKLACLPKSDEEAY